MESGWMSWMKGPRRRFKQLSQSIQALVISDGWGAQAGALWRALDVSLLWVTMLPPRLLHLLTLVSLRGEKLPSVLSFENRRWDIAEWINLQSQHQNSGSWTHSCLPSTVLPLNITFIFSIHRICFCQLYSQRKDQILPTHEGFRIIAKGQKNSSARQTLSLDQISNRPYGLHWMLFHYM